MKKWLGLLLCAAMLLGLAACAGNTQATYNDFQYKIKNDAVIITGYTGGAAKVTVPETIEGKPVTTIGKEAFAYSDHIKSVKLPEGTTIIGSRAFMWCEMMTTVELPSTLTDVGVGAFSNCTDLCEIELPVGLRAVGDNAFFYCNSFQRRL